MNQLSLDRYRPMFRLLSAGDIEFVRSCPGSNPRQVQRLRVRRARILRDYLRSLSSDFCAICRESEALIAHSSRSRSALRLQLLWRRWEFARKLAMVRVRLILFRWGMAQVEIRSLLYLFDTARISTFATSPATR